MESIIEDDILAYIGSSELLENPMMMMMMMMMMKCSCGIAHWGKGFSLISNRNHVKDPHHRETLTRLQKIWTCAEPEFRLCWMKLCSSGNHYTTVPLMDDNLHPGFVSEKKLPIQLTINIEFLLRIVWKWTWCRLSLLRFCESIWLSSTK